MNFFSYLGVGLYDILNATLLNESLNSWQLQRKTVFAPNYTTKMFGYVSVMCNTERYFFYPFICG